MKILPEPGPGRRRQLGLLAAVVVAGGLFLWWWAGPTTPPSAASNSEVRPSTNAAGLTLPDAVRFGELSDADAQPDVGRNPFAFGVRAAPVAPMPPPTLSGPALPPGPVEPVGPPPIPLRLTGMTVLPDSGRTLVTLRDSARGTLFQAFEGDIVDGRYKVVQVGTQSVVVSYLDGSGQRTLVLGG